VPQAEGADLVGHHRWSAQLLDEFLDRLELLALRRHDQRVGARVGLEPRRQGSCWLGPALPLPLAEEPGQGLGQLGRIRAGQAVGPDLEACDGIRAIELPDEGFGLSQLLRRPLNHNRIGPRSRHHPQPPSLGSRPGIVRLVGAVGAHPSLTPQKALEHGCHLLRARVLQGKGADLLGNLGRGAELLDQLFDRLEMHSRRRHDQDVRPRVRLEPGRQPAALFEPPAVLAIGKHPGKGLRQLAGVRAGQPVGSHLVAAAGRLDIQAPHHLLDLVEGRPRRVDQQGAIVRRRRDQDALMRVFHPVLAREQLADHAGHGGGRGVLESQRAQLAKGAVAAHIEPLDQGLDGVQLPRHGRGHNNPVRHRIRDDPSFGGRRTARFVLGRHARNRLAHQPRQIRRRNRLRLVDAHLACPRSGLILESLDQALGQLDPIRRPIQHHRPRCLVEDRRHVIARVGRQHLVAPRLLVELDPLGGRRLAERLVDQVRHHRPR